jgi:ADP-heptose:LPS heptosyltransferase
MTAPLGPGGALVQGVERIAVLRANAIGDFIVSLPALEALRAAYPDAELTLLACDWHRDFLAGRPGPVDRCVPVPPSVGVRDDRPPAPPAAVEAFLADMRARRFDLAVQLHGGGRHSNRFVRGLGARVTIGSRGPDAPPLDRWVPYTGYQPEVLRFLEVVGLAGAAPVTLEPRIQVTAADRAEAARALSEGGRDAPLVALHPGAKDPRRRWPLEKLAGVGAELAAKGARLLVIGDAGERELAARVVAGLGGQAADLSGRLSLGGLAALLQRCTLLVGNDSGPVHLAGAVGTATVAVYWCVNLLNAGPLSRTRRRALVSWRQHCPLCGADATRGGCPHPASFVAEVEAAEVAAEALDLLEREGGAANGG